MKPKINPQNPEEVKAYQKECYQLNKDKIKIERNKPENKLKLKLYQEAYNKRPEVILRKKERDTPEMRDERKLYSQKIYQKNKGKIKLYRAERYQKNKEEIKIERDKPENKARVKALHHTPKYKRKSKERYQNNKDKIKIERNKPENKLKLKLFMETYNKRPEVILKKKERDTPEDRVMNNKYSRRTRLKKLYNLTIEDYDNMVKLQNNKCTICGNEENGKRLAVDHNWKTGQIRGLLCKNCNTTLGNLKEDINLFYKCIEYLNKHKD